MKPRFVPLPASIVTLAITFLVPSSIFAQYSPVPGLDDYVTTAMKEWQVPGLAVAIVKDGQIVYERGYGVRDIESGKPVDEHTIFSIASTTKAMTVACLGMLVDEGKLSWDDPVTKYLPSFQLHDPWVTREFKVRDLLTHRSGLSRGDLLWYASPFSRSEVIERVRYLEPSSSFRSRYSYQNIMYITAGEVVAAASGMSWDDFVRTRLFEPLGMTSSSTSVKALEGKDNVATPYEFDDDNLVAVRWPNFDNLGGAGSVNSSVHDMAQWIRLNLAKGEFDGQQILSESVVDEMQTSQMAQRRDSLTKAVYPMTNMDAYGLGWGLQDYYGKLLVTHSGWLDGMRTRVAMLPQLNIGVVIIMNGPRARLHMGLALWILDHYLNVDRRDWAAIQMDLLKESDERAEKARTKRAESRIQNTSPTYPLDEYAGVYTDRMYGEISVTLDGGTLRLAFGQVYVGALEHRHYETFQVNWDEPGFGYDDILFVPGFDGSIASLKWSGVGEFTKKDEK